MNQITTSKKTFLVEIGTEELPSSNLCKLGKLFATNFTFELSKSKLSYDDVEWFITPRRLALKVINLTTFQQKYKIKEDDSIISKAFNLKGKPGKVTENWTCNCETTIEQTEQLTIDKKKWPFYCSHIKSKMTVMSLPKMVESALLKLPNAKLMRWGANNICFIRPVQTVTLLLGNQEIRATIFGVKSDRVILGHRFMGESKLIIDKAEEYPQLLLERGKVIANYEQRKETIKNDIKKAAQKIGGIVNLNDGLLEEVTSLVEWPVVLIAKFEENFLSIPIEILTFIMKDNHKCFPVYLTEDKLLPNFIFVANIESKNPQKIITGNEKVMHSRLSDAQFFFNIDRKKHLIDYLPQLETVLFQRKLGTLRERTNRIQVLSGWIAMQIGADVDLAMRAGLLSKCDLVTNMVFEFTKAQGVVGMHYARYDGEKEDVVIALKEQYRPRFSGDKLPSNLISCSVAIADKIDILVGIFGVFHPPKGDKDPFALRRAAKGILRILIEKSLNLDLEKITEKSVYLYNNKLTNNNVLNDIIDFMFNRLFSWYQEKGYSTNIIQSVLVCRPTCPIDFDARVKAVSYFCTLKTASNLIMMYKRISNILEKIREPFYDVVRKSLLRDLEEIKLADSLMLLDDKLQLLISENRYQDSLVELMSIYETVDVFFKNVLVNTNDKNVRINRLTLLNKLKNLFLGIADISLLQ